MHQKWQHNKLYLICLKNISQIGNFHRASKIWRTIITGHQREMKAQY